MNKKNICIISPSLKMGGIERALTVLANSFADMGYAVHFLSAQGGNKFYELNNKVNFHEPMLKRNGGLINKIKTYYAIIKFIKTTVDKIQPDVVLSFGDAFNPLVLFALKSANIPIFISDRTSPDFNFNYVIKISKKYLYPKSTGFIAQTKRAADYRRNEFNDRLNIRVIPNAIKNVILHDVPKKKSILCVGRLSYEKGQDRLIEAFSQLNSKDDWELILAGSGPMLIELKALAKKMKIEKKVNFLGAVENIDMLLSESSIFVLPSRLEGFPNALCEAMAAGLACICFDSIPTEAILENNKDGIVVEEGNISELSSKINFLVENELIRKKIGKKALEIRERLHVEKISKEFLTFMFNI